VASDSFAGGSSQVRIVHEEGGTFMAIPLDSHGKPLSKEYWKRSTKRAALFDRR
jgi:hypothetical protein